MRGGFICENEPFFFYTLSQPRPLINGPRNFSFSLIIYNFAHTVKIYQNGHKELYAANP